jgi:hypothetical protein
MQYPSIPDKAMLKKYLGWGDWEICVLAIYFLFIEIMAN